MDIDEFRKHGHALIEWLADYHASLGARPVQAATEPGDVRAMLPAEPPREPQPFEACIADLDSIVAPNLSHFQHPRFFGYFPANAMLAGVLGDLVSTGLGVIGLSWQASPALSEIEEVVTDWVRRMVGLSSDWLGVISDTASTCNLVAMVEARERATGYAMTRGGLQSEPAPLAVYASAGNHSSVEKGALVAGFGRENIRMVPLDGDRGMRPDALRQMIEADLATGIVPCAIVACVGGTATASMDPIRETAEIARHHGLWLHVDAAMAGSAMILPECRWMWDGIEGADSLVINAHKWLGAPFDCSLFYVRDEQHLLRVMSMSPSYLQSSVDDKVRNLRDTGIPLGRRFRALKLWFLIREQGVSGLQARLRRDLANAGHLAAMVDATPGWKVVAPVHLQTVCIRHEPEGLGSEALDTYTRSWAEAVNRSGEGYLTAASVDGRWLVRVSIGAPTTERDDVEAIWASIRRHASEVLDTVRVAPGS